MAHSQAQHWSAVQDELRQLPLAGGKLSFAKRVYPPALACRPPSPLAQSGRWIWIGQSLSERRFRGCTISLMDDQHADNGARGWVAARHPQQELERARHRHPAPCPPMTSCPELALTLTRRTHPPFNWAENGGIMAWRWDSLVGIYLPLLRVLHGRRNPNHLHIRQRQEGASAAERRDAQGRLDERCRP